MLQLRALDTLGGGNRDWLKARHHFAVDRQGNPAHARLGNLVVWNDDEIAPHSGFPMHGHCDMEIVTYVREGVLQHEDSSGGRGEIGPRNVQVITAGRGVRHSEYNDTNTCLRIFQIWPGAWSNARGGATHRIPPDIDPVRLSRSDAWKRHGE